jgi:hypothetical protein
MAFSRMAIMSEDQYCDYCAKPTAFAGLSFSPWGPNRDTAFGFVTRAVATHGPHGELARAASPSPKPANSFVSILQTRPLPTHVAGGRSFMGYTAGHRRSYAEFWVTTGIPVTSIPFLANDLWQLVIAVQSPPCSRRR